MSWICDRCDARWPDSGGARGDGCLSCTSVVDTRNPDLEDALDGVNAAVRYCEDRGLQDVANALGELYQTVGREAPAEDWSEKYTDENADEILADWTGEPIEKFQPPEDAEIPELDELESVDPEEVDDAE